MPAASRWILGPGSALLVLEIGCTPPSPSETASETGNSSSSSSGSSTAPTSTDSTATDGDTSTTGTSSSATGPGTGTTGDTGPDPVVPLDEFTCTGATWIYVDPTVSDPYLGSLLASDGRLIVAKNHAYPPHHTGLIFDTDGVPTEVFDFGVVHEYGWGGIDAQNHLYVTFDDDTSDLHTWLRKYDLAGSLVWEVDRGPVGDKMPWPGQVVVAPDGTSLINTAYPARIERYDVAGALVYDKQVPDKFVAYVFAMNTAGRAVAERTAPHTLVVLDADANPAWEHPVEPAYIAGADIDEAGNVVAVVADAGIQTSVLRLAPDGALVSDVALDLAPLVEQGPEHLAANEAGEVAIALQAYTDGHPVAVAVTLDSGGGVLTSIVCDPASVVRTVQISEAGAVYLTGRVYADDGEHLFAAAFE